MTKSRQRLQEHVFITIPTMVGVAYFVLWACAPPAALPPPVPMTGSPYAPPPNNGLTQNPPPNTVTGELGVGIVGGAGSLDGFQQLEPEAGAWVWLSAHIDKPRQSTDLGLVVSGHLLDGGGAGAGGGYLRIMKKRPASQLGVEFSGGFLWARVAMPYMKQTSENSWLYLSPGITGSFISDVRLPIGVAIKTGALGVIRLEGGAALRLVDSFSPAFYVGFSGSLRFGKALREQAETSLEPALPNPLVSPTSAPLTAPPCLPCSPTSIPSSNKLLHSSPEL